MRQLKHIVRGIAVTLWLAWLVGAGWLLLTGLSSEERLIVIETESLLALAWLGLTPVALVIAWEFRRSSPTEAQSVYRLLAEKTSDALLIYNGTGDLEWRNAAARGLFPDPAAVPANILALVERCKRQKIAAMQMLPVGNARHYHVQAFPFGADGAGVIVRAPTEDAARSRFYDNFIRRIVHDMRNPLAAIIGHAANLRTVAVPDAEQLERTAVTIEDQAQRLARLVDSMLFDARLAYVPLAPERLDLVEVIEDALYTLEDHAITDGKQIDLETPPDGVQITGDRDLLVRAFENLLDNSLKHTDAQGIIRVCLTVTPEEYHLTFSDNGTGIPPEFLPDRIFEPLVRATRAPGGSGLGLSIVKKIIEMHGGRIHAESQLHQGTTMHIYLPLRMEGH